jgi:hypothetical protein
VLLIEFATNRLTAPRKGERTMKQPKRFEALPSTQAQKHARDGLGPTDRSGRAGAPACNAFVGRRVAKRHKVGGRRRKEGDDGGGGDSASSCAVWAVGVVERVDDVTTSGRRRWYTVRYQQQEGVPGGEVERVTEEELEGMLLSSVHPYSALGVRTCACLYCTSCIGRRGYSR